MFPSDDPARRHDSRACKNFRQYRCINLDRPSRPVPMNVRFAQFRSIGLCFNEYYRAMKLAPINVLSGPSGSICQLKNSLTCGDSPTFKSRRSWPDEEPDILSKNSARFNPPHFDKMGHERTGAVGQSPWNLRATSGPVVRNAASLTNRLLLRSFALAASRRQCGPRKLGVYIV